MALDLKVVQGLEENSYDVYLEVTDIILKIINNILRFPTNPRYRQLKFKSALLLNKLCPSHGCIDVLLCMGFESRDDIEFFLPDTIPLSLLETYANEIHKRKEVYRKRLLSQIWVFQTKPVMTKFLKNVEQTSRAVLLYDDKQLRKKALSVMPLDKIKEKCKNKSSSNDMDEQLNLAAEVMSWFKLEFFKWVDCPKCLKCGGKSTFKYISSDPQECRSTLKVEVFFCNNCNERLLFPRYNDLYKLLETRQGRCGEWANCFTLFCRSVGLEARYVVDKTDHVWTEVYSEVAKRWVHFDPCEGVLDTPLMYEMGWKKKLSYIIAYSPEEVQDVTWRYTSQFEDVRSRRTLCSEGDLNILLLQLSYERQIAFCKAKRQQLEIRRVSELSSFFTPPVSTGSYIGRVSGSLSWKLERGECEKFLEKSCIWQPNKTEIDNKRFRLQYSSAQDKYYRVESNEYINGWQNGIFKADSIFRKEEHDWETTYLCRLNNSERGTIFWKFDIVPDSNQLIIEDVEIHFTSKTFHNGCVELILRSENMFIELNADEKVYKTSILRGCTSFTLVVSLSGGSGDESWQHAQLFRQTFDSKDYPFEIYVTFCLRG